MGTECRGVLSHVAFNRTSFQLDLTLMILIEKSSDILGSPSVYFTVDIYRKADSNATAGDTSDDLRGSPSRDVVWRSNEERNE